MSFAGSNKKRNFSSPGKTQTSIVLFTAQGKSRTSTPRQNVAKVPL
jgi:hypothetical protein